MTATLRPATAGDLMTVGHLHHRSRATAYRGLVPDEALAVPSADMLGRWWTERWSYERDSCLLTVAEWDGEVIGFSCVGPDPDGEPDTGLLDAIHLDPTRQGQGIGRALMVDALTTLHERGFRSAALWVLTGNAHARRFYERGGWTTDGTGRDEHIGPAVVRQLRYIRRLS